MNAIIRYATILMACTLSFTPSIKDAIAFQPGCNASPARGEELPAATPLQPSRLFASGPITGATDPSEVKTGYAIVLPPSGRPAPNGVLVFSLAQDSILVSEAGVPASSPPTSWAQLFVDVQNPSINTGIAVANPYDRPANLTLRLSDVENRPLSSANLPTIPAGGQIARFVTELLPSVQPAPGGVFRGVLTISSDVPVSIVALRLTINERHETLLTAFPVADQNLRKGPSSLPQVASGGGFKTQLLLLNPIAGSLSGTVDFFDSSGSPLSLPIGGRTVSSLRYSIPPGGAFFAETDGTGSLSSGWARVLPDGDDLAPAAMAVFSFRS